MNLLDKIYLNIFWCGNKGKGGGLIDGELEKLLMIILWGIIMIITSLICAIIKLDIKIAGLIIISGVISFFASEKIFNKYYTVDRKGLILSTNQKPGKIKYLILILSILVPVAFLLIASIISAIIYHRFVIG
jgi:uncharacterized membrane-anchored protein